MRSGPEPLFETPNSSRTDRGGSPRAQADSFVDRDDHAAGDAVVGGNSNSRVPHGIASIMLVDVEGSGPRTARLCAALIDTTAAIGCSVMVSVKIIGEGEWPWRPSVVQPT
jgi:hypothetical protein